MTPTVLPVFIKGDGGALVKVGTATLLPDRSGFVLELGQVVTGNKSVAAASGTGGGLVFPNYGRSKGLPIAGAPEGELRYYANGSRRSLQDPTKSRFHAKERALFDAIQAELRGRGLAPEAEPSDATPGDDFGPPAGIDDGLPV